MSIHHKKKIHLSDIIDCILPQGKSSNFWLIIMSHPATLYQPDLPSDTDLNSQDKDIDGGGDDKEEVGQVHQ